MVKSDDLVLLEQLYYGNHLEPKELDRIKKVLHGLNIALKNRVR